MKIVLTAISDSYEGKTYTIEANQCVTFGRTSGSQWSFDDDFHMSSIHFEVENFGDHAEVRDRGSTNGTWLNKQKIQRETLREGDTIRAGRTSFTVEFVKPLEPADSASSRTPVARPDFENRPAASDMAPPPPLQPLQPLQPPASHSPGPLSPRPAASRPINPFDSVDFVQPERPDLGTRDVAFPPIGAPQGKNKSPIESSMSLKVPAEIQQIGRAPVVPAAVDRYQLLKLRSSNDAADGMAIILDSLAQKWSLQLILHFHKIRSVPPVSAQSCRPLFHWLSPTDGHAYSPIILGWNEVRADAGLLALLPRLCRADACLAFLGLSAVDVVLQTERMLQMEIEGLSEPGGFLPCCWPSSFSAMVDGAGVQICGRLFEDKISGAIFCSPWDRYGLFASADLQLGDDLRDAQFATTDRIIQR